MLLKILEENPMRLPRIMRNLVMEFTITLRRSSILMFSKKKMKIKGMIMEKRS